MIRIDVFGPLRIEVDGQPENLPRTAARAIVAWLALHPGRHSRARVMEATGVESKNLRPALSHLRESRLVAEGALWFDERDIELRRGPDVEITYDTVLAAQRDDAPLDVREQAFEILTGDDRLLEGLLEETPADWIGQARTQAEELAIELAARTASDCERGYDISGAAVWSRLWTELEPLSEPAASAYMRRLHASGDMPRAIAAGEAFEARLEREGMEPSGRFAEELAALRSSTASAPRAVSLIAEVPVSSRVELLGRGAALAQLRDRIARADPPRQLLIIEGESGVGKTRLCAEIAEEWGRRPVGGAAALYGRFAPETGSEYTAFSEALGGYLFRWDPATLRSQLGDDARDLHAVLPELSSRLTRLPPPAPADPGVARRRLFDAVANLLRRLAAGGPTLLILDDLHEADPSSLRLLAHAVSYTDASQLTYLCTTRPAVSKTAAATIDGLREDHPDAVLTISLDALSDSDATTMAMRLLGRPLTEDETRVVTRRSTGNPARVELSCLMLPRPPEPAGDPSTEPELGPEERRALQVAAILGSEFSVELVAAAAGITVADARVALGRAADVNLLERGAGEDQFLFPHDVRRRAYLTVDALPEHERALASRRAAEYLDGRPDAVPLLQARLWREAGAAERAVEHLRTAADDATTALAAEAAASHLREALQLVPPDPAHDELRARLMLERGEALWNAGHFREATQTFRSAADIAGKPEDLARAALGYAGRLGFQGVTTDVSLTDLLQRALDAQEEADSPTRARLTATLAQALTFLSAEHRSRGEQLSRDAEAMASRLADKQPDGAEVVVDVLCRTSWVTWTPLNLEDRLELADKMVRLAADRDMPARELESRIFKICGHLESGDVESARHEWERCVELADALRLPYYTALVTFVHAMFELLEGPTAADPRAREALEVGKRQEQPVVMQLFGVQALHIYLLLGRAEELISASRDLARYYAGFAAWRSGLALICAESGQMIDALEQIDGLVGPSGPGVPEDMFWLICMHHISRALCLAAPDPSERRALKEWLYEALLPFRDRYMVAGGAMAVHGSAAFPLGLLAAALGDLEDADRQLDYAARQARRIGCVPAEAEARVERARVRLELDPGEVRTALGLLEGAVEAASEHNLIRVAANAVEVSAQAEAQAISGDAGPLAAEAGALAVKARTIIDAATMPPLTTSWGWRTLGRLGTSSTARIGRRALEWSDEKLESRLLNRSVQTALFGGMAKLYQADRGYGFHGDIGFRITTSGRSIEWTITVNGRNARAQPRSSSLADVAITIGCRNFVRLLARELNGVEAWVTGQLQLRGDPIVAARLVEMFGGGAALAAL